MVYESFSGHICFLLFASIGLALPYGILRCGLSYIDIGEKTVCIVLNSVISGES